MGEKLINRIIALTIITFLLIWNVSPVIGYAGSFITPGKAITPGESFAPGKPIQGGQFIVPGEVYEPGEGYDSGKAVTSSGQPILPNAPFNQGAFIIPNATPIAPGSLYWELKGLEGGNGIQGGNTINGGTNASGGKGPNAGDAINAGQGTDGGDALNGGQGTDGGDAVNGGQGTDGGNALNGGKSTDGGNAMDGGQSTKGGDATGTGKASNGGDGTSSSTSDDPPPSLLNVLVKTTDGEKGWFSHVTGFFDDFKTYGLGFLNRDVAGATLSMAAGFKISEIEGTNGYKVSGKRNYKNKILNNLYQRYKSYDVDGNGRSLGTHTKRIKKSTLNAFLNHKELRPKGMDLTDFVKSSLKSGVIDGWSPFTKKVFSKELFTKNAWKSGSLFNKAFISKSNMIKMNGPLNYVMATAGTIWDYSPKGEKSKIGFGSADFAADLTTELAIGVGSTAIGSIASSVVTGMAAGSVVPGLGTVLGAAAGLGAGLVTTYLINGTTRGRNIKDAVTGGIKSVYKGIGKGVKEGWKRLGGLFG